jgi:hypothetical protein
LLHTFTFRIAMSYGVGFFSCHFPLPFSPRERAVNGFRIALDGLKLGAVAAHSQVNDGWAQLAGASVEIDRRHSLALERGAEKPFGTDLFAKAGLCDHAIS